MSILEKIDKNYAQQTIKGEVFDEYKIPCEPFAVYGGVTYYENEGFHKWPLEVVKKVGFYWGSRLTTGVRITFSTDAQGIKIKTKQRNMAPGSFNNILEI